MRLSWFFVYVLIPYFLVYDVGKHLTAKVFQKNAKLPYIGRKDVPIKAPSSFTYVIRHHKPICQLHDIIKSGDIDLDVKTILQIAVKSVKDWTVPNGLIAMLLIYRTLPRLDIRLDKLTVPMCS